MKINFSPLFVAPSVTRGDTTVFYKINEKVTLIAPGKLVKRLVEICDGVCTTTEIVHQLSAEWETRSVQDLLRELVRLGVLAHGANLAEAWWPSTMNPSRFPLPITDLQIARMV